ncbi:MAG TPA: response regulator, partial [Gemmatimonadales bacterium]|nr:response regulator [Gemmatimonadales bacterium]
MARILVMEDDPSFRNAVRVVLEAAGYEVIEAADGAVGLRLHREQGADLVLVDIFMPERDGLEVIRALKIEAPGAKIIAMSGG